MSFKLGYQINAKKSAFLQNITIWIWTRTKMTIFNIIEKQQKSCFLPSGFLQRSSLQNQKSTFTVKFSPCLSLEVPFLVLSHLQGWAAAFCSSASWPNCLHFQHYDCIACWEIARIFYRVRSFPHFFHVYTKSTATPTYHRNFAIVAISSGHKFQCCSRSRNSPLVESHRNFDSEEPFFQFHEEQAKFANKVHHLTRFFEKVDSSLP